MSDYSDYFNDPSILYQTFLIEEMLDQIELSQEEQPTDAGEKAGTSSAAPLDLSQNEMVFIPNNFEPEPVEPLPDNQMVFIPNNLVPNPVEPLPDNQMVFIPNNLVPNPVEPLPDNQMVVIPNSFLPKPIEALPNNEMAIIPNNYLPEPLEADAAPRFTTKRIFISRPRCKMAVKKHELLANSSKEIDLKALAEYIRHMNEPSYLPMLQDITKQCRDIIHCLSSIPVAPGDFQIWEQLGTVEEFILRLVNRLDPDLRQDIVSAILETFYDIVTAPDAEASAAVSIVLAVFGPADSESIASAALWAAGKATPNPSAVRSSLSYLYRWITISRNPHTLGCWTLAYVKALEQKKNFEILTEVTLYYLRALFAALATPSVEQSVSDVILHVLSSLRNCTEAFTRICPDVERVLEHLAADSDQNSRPLLSNVVDIISDMLNKTQSRYTQTRGPYDEYAHIKRLLERHMPARGWSYLQSSMWTEGTTRPTVLTPTPFAAPVRSVGLQNLGSTCYMNSVMQALYLTRRFSNYVMMRQYEAPYWSLLSGLFAKMCHTKGEQLQPFELLTIKPNGFAYHQQYDGSEYLSFLFDLLIFYENVSGVGYDYRKPPIHDKFQVTPMLESYENDLCGNSNALMLMTPSGDRRSLSPRPGGSGTGTSSGLKRSALEDFKMPPKKRSCMQIGHFTTMVEQLFGGTMVTRIECLVCQSNSLSRDPFRDIQLAFPEKPEPGKPYTVQQLIDYYFSKERLYGENRYYCPDCTSLNDADKSIAVENTPKYLIVILKHFKFEQKRGMQTKLMHRVYFNDVVTVPTVLACENSYKLYAAVIHNGTSLDAGHYYTVGKDGSHWYIYNDEMVTPCSEYEINSLTSCSTPYILFYRRTDVEEASAPALKDLPTPLQELVQSYNKMLVGNNYKFRAVPTSNIDYGELRYNRRHD